MTLFRQLGLLLVTPFTQNLMTTESCLSNNFLGNYQDAGTIFTIHIIRDDECLQASSSRLNSAHYGPAPDPREQLVWLEKAAIDETLQAHIPQSKSILNELLLSLQAPVIQDEPELQKIMSSHATTIPSYNVHYSTDTAALISLDSEKARVIDTLLPPFWKSKLLPTAPSTYLPIPTAAIATVKTILTRLKFDPVVASIVNNISVPQIQNDVRFLTGEDGKSGIISRHSFSTGAITAANWLRARVEDTGATCRLSPFLPGFAPNVICRYDAIKDTNATVLVSGHYDSRGSFGSIRAPGGDDDGSGTTGVLSIARTIARKGVKFHSNVELAFFAGEEQGLLGSRAYARELREAGANLTLMVQADMTAYRAPGEPLQLGLPDIIGSPEVTQLVANISAIYSPELTIGFTPACCSDHQSFHEQGFPATQVFERAGPIADPMYHNSGDLSGREGFDLQQLYAIAKVQFATILHTAGYEL
ncbi:hypothetical protein NLJ89_g1214 [Agrocybe chaxingu]|uniref:Peptide hydrolase n=1 Tax=Agrocybe chaxingu TaxID=84603 RepID=A0A9W8N0J6_9AGAR|nr:hypothetical protein NLJ89_g1214 [Agrocybe chaxingu]